MTRNDAPVPDARAVEPTTGPGSAPTVVAPVPAAWPAGLGAAVAGLLVAVAPSSLGASVVAVAAFSLLTLPYLLARYVPDRVVVGVAVVLVLVPLVLGVGQRLTLTEPSGTEIHDGLIITDEAARVVVRGGSPYDADYSAALPPVWHELGTDARGEPIRNPALDRYMYLPGSFLVEVPFMAVAQVAGIHLDGRILYVLAVALLVLVVVRRPEPAQRRAAMLVGAAGLPLAYFVWWGTNDGVSLAMFLVGALTGQDPRRRRWAGLALAVAVSCKAVLVVPLLAVAVLVVRREGWRGLGSWWTLPAVLTATVLPYLVADPARFFDDTVLFNLNRSSFRFPVQGIGLPALVDGFHGPSATITTFLAAIAALVGPGWAVWRRPTLPVALVGGGLGLLGVFVPATNFRVPYLVLVIGLVASGWLGLDRRDGRPPPRPGATDRVRRRLPAAG